MIDRSEIETVGGQFGAPDAQIIRDHLISHILAAIADWADCDHVTFFGGTALCRTWLPDLRLSEDIDLLVAPNTNGGGLRSHISRRLRREFPNLTWTRLGSQHEIETWSITGGGLAYQLADLATHARAAVVVEERYSEVFKNEYVRGG